MYRLRLFLVMLCLPLVASLLAQSLAERLDPILASPRDSHQMRKFRNLHKELINTGEIVHDTLFERALALAHELHDTLSLTVLHANQSVYNLNMGEVGKGLVNIDEAIKYAIASNQADWLPFSYTVKMELLMVGGNTKESAELASAQAKEYHKTGDFYNEAEAYQLLSKISASLGNYELTMMYDSIAIALARQINNPGLLASILCSSSDNYNLLGYPEKGLLLAEEALVVAEENKLEFEIGNLLNSRAVANTALGNYAEALKDHELLKELEGDQGYSWWMIGRGILLQRIGRHEEARKLLLEAVQLIKATSNNPLELKRCYQALQTVGLNQAQYDSVAWYGKLMETEQDSLQTAKNIRNLLELEEKYKAEEKEAEIRLQQEQLARQAQEEQLARQRVKLYATACGLLLALIMGIIFFRLSQRLEKSNLEKEQLLSEKETLIGEIHHRVKNNLQVVSSLLQLQRRGLDSDDEKGQEALLESQSRVGAMGLIHIKLYQGKEVTSVHMPEYLEDLGETLLDAYRLEEQVEIFYDVADINLKVDIAIHLGLIINELVTNAMKYAFPKGQEGTIEIALYRENDQLLLVVADNGVGTAGAKKRADSTSFGSNLIRLLTKKLKGEIKVLEGQGYGVEIRFPEQGLVND
ncbi:histidine kinase dimerization/phosphoacceptor domain -containing protein [Neolewinella persica]|uniref:histidine kinase dimerization/phosphoacceptor domain -containing protein n=1 Tax=Neolewinella persica TaxID=70998 RepID=UPI001FE12FE5|nr:histidine kinase dimerization/phosphoacceptor domain -containing protein [Neolewinella persica]